jgi:hypothetical protein
MEPILGDVACATRNLDHRILHSEALQNHEAAAITPKTNPLFSPNQLLKQLDAFSSFSILINVETSKSQSTKPQNLNLRKR